MATLPRACARCDTSTPISSGAMNDDGPLGRLGGDLTAAQISQLAVVLRMLEVDQHAPTAVRAGKRAVDVHVADSLAALELDGIRAAHRIADLGSGAGFPGLALAVALPAAEIRLVESQRRRCEFLERVCADAEIENARVVWARAEEWRDGLGCHDGVVAGAPGAPPVVLEYAAPLLRLGGSVVDWRGKRVRAQENVATRAADELGLRRL